MASLTSVVNTQEIKQAQANRVLELKTGIKYSADYVKFASAHLTCLMCGADHPGGRVFPYGSHWLPKMHTAGCGHRGIVWDANHDTYEDGVKTKHLHFGCHEVGKNIYNCFKCEERYADAKCTSCDTSLHGNSYSTVIMKHTCGHVGLRFQSFSDHDKDATGHPCHDYEIPCPDCRDDRNEQSWRLFLLAQAASHGLKTCTIMGRNWKLSPNIKTNLHPAALNMEWNQAGLSTSELILNINEVTLLHDFKTVKAVAFLRRWKADICHHFFAGVDSPYFYHMREQNDEVTHFWAYEITTPTALFDHIREFLITQNVPLTHDDQAKCDIAVNQWCIKCHHNAEDPLWEGKRTMLCRHCNAEVTETVERVESQEWQKIKERMAPFSLTYEQTLPAEERKKYR